MSGMRVLAAMSGGVDSAVAAARAADAGHEVTGVHLALSLNPQSYRSGARGCCTLEDARDARRAADVIGIPFYVWDMAERFHQDVVEDFVAEYARGRTPNPCLRCNEKIKFAAVLDRAVALGFDAVCTGHHARLTGGRLHRSPDPAKDQSYVLFGLDPKILSRVLLPVGAYQKQQIRALARQAGLNVADKPDSVEICFVPGGHHGALIRARRPSAATAGRIVDTAGTVLAEHRGFENFTVGQRKGLGFAAGRRRYVLRIVAEQNEVVVGDREELLAGGLIATRVNWLTDPPPESPVSCAAKIRYRHEGASATVTVLPSGGAQVEFHEPQSAVTPGQAVVFYDGSRVLGGGWIEQTL